MSDNASKSGFFNPDSVVAANLASAETELNAAIEAERPDEIGANLPQDPASKPTGFAPSEPPAQGGTNWQKRYGDLQRYIDKKLKPEFKAETDKLREQITELTKKIETLTQTGAPTNLPQSVEEMEKLKKESPAAFNAIVALATSIAEGVVNQKVTSLEKGFEEIKKGQEVNQAAAAEVALKRLHPDFDAIVGTEEFHIWLQSQAKVFQDAIYNSYDVEAADGVLKMYKATLGKPSKGKGKPGANADVSVTSPPNLPSGNKGWKYTETQLAAMSSSEFNKNAEDIDKAIREGAVLMDISDKIGAAQRMAAQAV